MQTRLGAIVFAVLVITSALVSAASRHEVTFKGTVISATDTVVKVSVIDEKTKKPKTMSFDMDKETKIFRGAKPITLAAAKIQKDEKIAVTIDHDVDETLAITVKLDETK